MVHGIPIRFGEERLKALLRGALGASGEEVSARLSGEMRAWIAGAEQHDDLTFVVAAVNDSLAMAPARQE